MKQKSLLDAPVCFVDKMNKDYNNMNNSIYHYFNGISKDEYNKHHTSMNNEIICNAVFKSNTINNFLRKSEITLVDIGAGCCDLEKKLVDVLSPDQDILIIAVDRSSNMLRNKKIVPEGFPFNIRFLVADATSLGLQDNCSEITFVINVLPYIKNIKSFSNELYRITRNKGLIIIVNPVKDKFNFWERYINDLKIHFHENIEKFFSSNKFQLIENSQINLNPVQDVEIIKVPIAELIIVKVKK
jgi:ubiquinone/menaquinone biosynthesis C-methylase UbiE